jgi:S-adenosyl methyltransferase
MFCDPTLAFLELHDGRTATMVYVEPSEIDTSVPQSARIWNYWLGGKDNYEADRAAGDAVLRGWDI